MFLDFKAQFDCLLLKKTFSLDFIFPVRALEPDFSRCMYDCKFLCSCNTIHFGNQRQVNSSAIWESSENLDCFQII